MKKITSQFLIFLLAIAAILIPSISKAATEAELNTSIASVQSQIQTLQAKLSLLQSQLQETRQAAQAKAMAANSAPTSTSNTRATRPEPPRGPSASGTSTMILSAPFSPLRSQNYRNNGFDTLSNIPLSVFNLRSEGGDSKLAAVNAAVAGTGTLPSTVYLYSGSTLLKSKVVPANGVVSFNDLSFVIPNGPTLTFTVKADFPSTTLNDTFANMTIKSVYYQSPSGASTTSIGAPVPAANQHIYNAAAQFNLSSTPTVTTQSNASGKTTSVTANFNMYVAALGGTVRLPNSSDFGVNLINTSGQRYPSTNIAVITIPNNDISDGTVATVSVTASWIGSTLPPPGLHIAAINFIRWTAGTNTVPQDYGLEEFKTPNAVGIFAQNTNTFSNQVANVFDSFMKLLGL